VLGSSQTPILRRRLSGPASCLVKVIESVVNLVTVLIDEVKGIPGKDLVSVQELFDYKLLLQLFLVIVHHASLKRTAECQSLGGDLFYLFPPSPVLSHEIRLELFFLRAAELHIALVGRQAG